MFRSGSPVKGKDFIDRKKHLPLFRAYLDNNQHIMIKAPRRFGKTSLIKHIFEFEKNYRYIYIDIRLASSLNHLSNQILDKAYSFVKIDNFIRKSKQSLYELLQSIKNIKIDNLAQLTIEHINKETDESELFIHSLNVVEQIAASQNINIKVIFDEFQDIVNLKDDHILDLLRSVAQHHQNITYLFLGSIESIMTKIFENKSSPFFHFASVVQLDGLDTKELLDYTTKQFDIEKISYNKEAIHKTIEFLQGHPEYSAKVLQTLFINSKLNHKSIDEESCKEAISFRLIENRAYLDEVISKIKTKKYHFELLYDISNSNKSTLNSATLYNTHTSLESLGLIKKISKGKYELVDIFLKLLLKQDNDELMAIDGKLKLEL